MRILPLAAVLLLLAGCELWDQRTVARWLGEAPVAPTTAARDLPPLPLVVVRFDHPDPNYQAALAEAAQNALTRKATAIFDIITPVSDALPAADRDAFVRRGADDARRVADALATDGVPPGQLRLGMVADAGSPAREVRVFVR